MSRSKIKIFAIKPLFFSLLMLTTLVLTCVVYMSLYLPDKYNVFEGYNLSISSSIPIKCEYCNNKSVFSNNNKSGNYSVNLKAFGVIPIKTAEVSVIDEKQVDVLGNSFGIKIYTSGVLIIKTDTVDTEKGNLNLCDKAGIKVGDFIISINGKKVYSNEDVASIIENSAGNELNLLVNRNGNNIEIKLRPVKSFSNDKYKAGIWVRDSSAGVGTLTFYSPKFGVICGLGHGVCDSDTGELLTMNSGEIVGADIIDVTKGIDGSPGQLQGTFTGDKMGDLITNGETGVYANYSKSINPQNLTQIALKQEIKTGNASIITTVDESGPQKFSCKIEKISYNNKKTKNLVITVTDKRLIEKTGGIVQGMSGSPIIQNGKLVGAVTHVFVNNPLSGYGIFAENMLDSAEKANEIQIKKAS